MERATTETGGRLGKPPCFTWKDHAAPGCARKVAVPCSGAGGVIGLFPCVWGEPPPPHTCLSHQNDGRLRLSRQGVIFKNSKTGKVDNIQASELAEGVWRRVALGHGLKLLTKNGHVYKYDGFRESVSPPAPACLARPCPWLVSLLLLACACPVLSCTPCESRSTDPPRTALTPIFLTASFVPGWGCVPVTGSGQHLPVRGGF